MEEKSITDTDSHTGRVIPDLSSGNETSKKSDNAIVPTPQPYIQNHFINIFPSAVTPPPTPPNDNLKEIITDQNVGIPNVQLNSKAQHELDQTADQKLGEQRSQNKYYQEYCELEQNRYIKGTELSNSENNQVNLEAHEMPLEDNANEKQLQTTLLKDALQCAKRYKEKFQSDRSTKQLCIKTEDTTMKLGQLHEQKSGTHLHHNTNYRPEDKSCKSAWSLEITGTRYSDSNFKRQEDRVEADNDTSSYQSSWESIEQHSRYVNGFM